MAVSKKRKNKPKRKKVYIIDGIPVKITKEEYEERRRGEFSKATAEQFGSGAELVKMYFMTCLGCSANVAMELIGAGAMSWRRGEEQTELIDEVVRCYQRKHPDYDILGFDCSCENEKPKLSFEVEFEMNGERIRDTMRFGELYCSGF